MLSMRDAGEGKLEITEMKEFADSVAVDRLTQLVQKIRKAQAGVQ
jgi:hypothetical protein